MRWLVSVVVSPRVPEQSHCEQRAGHIDRFAERRANFRVCVHQPSGSGSPRSGQIARIRVLKLPEASGEVVRGGIGSPAWAHLI